MLKERIEALELPAPLERTQMLRILYEQEYGFPPPPPLRVWGEEEACQPNAWAGKAVEKKIRLWVETERGSASFPFCWTVPKSEPRPVPVVLLSFQAESPNRYYPAEEAVDRGLAVACLGYETVACDRDDGFQDPLPRLLRDGPQPEDGWGKLGLWAWAASRIADYLMTLPGLDTDNLAVMGHSRLGKTALLAAAGDERVTFAMSNDSGCSGAALARGTHGERVEDICKHFPHWFCPNYQAYRGRETAMPFDQHFLLKAIEPRYVYVTSAAEDDWADPEQEYLACVAAGGMVHPDRMPQCGDAFREGRLGYHLRSGSHFLSRYDWDGFIRFIQAHRITHDSDGGTGDGL